MGQTYNNVYDSLGFRGIMLWPWFSLSISNHHIKLNWEWQ